MNFDSIKQSAKKEWEEFKNSQKPSILIGTATCGRAAGALEVLQTFKTKKLDCNIIEVGCAGLCYAEPLVYIIKPGQPGLFYGNITAEKARNIIQNYLIKDIAFNKYAIGDRSSIFKNQVRRVLKNCGFIDPTNINHYIANNGYEGFIKALSIGPDRIIEEIGKSGLRGRGGAGFPTFQKWRIAKERKAKEKYLICNADEGDPGAFMNRALIESDPHSLIEGMLIASLAIGATEGYIYCRAEYPLALERLRTAIGQAQGYGLLGKNILDSGIDFSIKIKEGAGAFVCGEETALIASIEGNRGMPRPRPPFPAISGLWGKPTIINNVETLANVALILQNGAEWFTQYGTEKSKGTKTFALVGKVNNTALVEVPLGITLKQMIYEIGGGILDNKKFKAVQTGGPSGGCIPADLLDIPVDYDSLKAAGTIMGSGGMVVMDETTCMVDFARYFLDFAQKESCGKCVPCRLGTKQMLDILEDITKGKGKPEDIDLLVEIAEAVKTSSLCGLGQTAPNPVLTTVRYFRGEYEAHIKYKQCPASVCKEIISSPCQHTCPIGTEVPVYISHLVQGHFKEAFDIIIKDNPLPSVCARVCHHPCENKCQAGKWGEPIAIRALKRSACEYAVNKKVYPSLSRRYKKKHKNKTSNKVAIIGSGPAGLTAGYYLANKGHNVTIFEAMDRPGGALMSCIPEYRLPRDILERDIQHIKNAGVKIETNTKVGKDIPFKKLLMDYKAIFIAAGAHKSRKMNIPNEGAEGVIDAMEFLKMQGKCKIGKRIAIIGGGNAAIDAARAAKRLNGCEKVSVIYRRTRDEMPAFKEEVDALIEEGIALQPLTQPTKILVKNGKAAGIECVKMRLGEIDESGRRKPVPIKGSEIVIDLDTIIVAVGEEPDTSFLSNNSRIKISVQGAIVVDPKTFATNIDGVFAGGDVVTGPNTVIDAMASGKTASEMIDNYIQGKKLSREYMPTRPSIYLPPVKLTEKEIEQAQRPEISALAVRKRIKNFDEVELTLPEKTAVKEARRCLRCDLDTEDGKNAIRK